MVRSQKMVTQIHAVFLTNAHYAFIFLLCSEFIGEDGNEKFWQFVDTVKELTVYKQGGMLFVIGSIKIDLR